MKKFFFYLIFFATGSFFVLFDFTKASAPLFQETMQVGKKISIALTEDRDWAIQKVTNKKIISVFLLEKNVIIEGLSSGKSTVSICSNADCSEYIINVTGNVLGVSTGNANETGAWVLNNKTVYYISVEGLIPVPSWDIFISNGGRSSKIKPILPGDRQSPTLALMGYNDSRLK